MTILRATSTSESQESLLRLAREDPALAELIQEKRRRSVRRSFHEWCTEVLSAVGQRPARHHRMICDRLEAVARGEVDRLRIHAPPGSAKSTYATVLFPAWWFTQHPRSDIICASHTGDLAERFGRRVRDLVEEQSDLLGYSISANSRAAGMWTTDAGGNYLAAGVGKAIAGYRTDLTIIDDPVSSRQSAESEADREMTWNWYRGDLYNRMKPGARIVLIMTRWHPDDLGGRLREEEDLCGDKWEELTLQAVCEDPETDPLGREVGEALWPEWEDAEALQRKRSVIGEREWSAQFQQRPTPLLGSLFRPENMPVIERLPTPQDLAANNVIRLNLLSRNLRGTQAAEPPPWEVRKVRAWDLSATEKTGSRSPDWTVGVLMGRYPTRRYIVEHMVRGRGTPHYVEQLIVETAEMDGPDVMISLPQDPGQAGKSQIAYLRRQLAGFSVVWRTASGSKETRAMPVASQVEIGNISILRGAWDIAAFCQELKDFPGGQHDDVVDAFADAYSRLLPPAEAQQVGTMRHSPVHIYRR